MKGKIKLNRHILLKSEACNQIFCLKLCKHCSSMNLGWGTNMVDNYAKEERPV